MVQNNSLNDLSNNGIQFNSPLDASSINSATSKINGDKQLQQLQLENTQLTKQLEALNSNFSNDSATKASLQSRININNTKINNLNSPSTNADPKSGFFDITTNNSMFDRFAIIDYARYVTSTPWDEFKKNGDKFAINSDVKALNQAVPGDASLQNSNDGLSIKHLVSWSEKYPALQLKFQDFVYCKRLTNYPNNRLIVLRRFKHGVPDNLFDYYVKNTNVGSNAFLYTQPLATMITWLKPDESPITLTFNEGWEDVDNGIANEVAKAGKESKESKENTLAKFSNIDSSFVSAILEKLGSQFQRKDGVNQITRSILGNPNLIVNAKRRSTGPGNKNLSSTIEFPNLTFEYEMRYISGVDPGIAILDLISNSLRMGTSVSEFKYQIPFLTDNAAITNIINGEIQVSFENFKKAMTDFFGDIKTSFENIVNGIVDAVANSNFKNLKADTEATVNTIAKVIISTYRERLKGALSADTGLPSGIWHVTIGNPKNPIVSCGDLILKSSNLKLGTELGYNDFPNSFTVTYTVSSARERGRDEIERIMNVGKGRVYVYPDWKSNPDYDEYSAPKN